MFPSVYQPVGLVLGVVALVVGVRAHLRARRERAVVPRAVVAGIVMGAVGTAVSIPMLAVSMFFHAEMGQYAKCHASANTIADEQACKDAFVRSIEKKVRLRQGSLRTGDIPF
jgi:predicted ABC-type sugar transport system permease subunit